MRALLLLPLLPLALPASTHEAWRLASTLELDAARDAFAAADTRPARLGAILARLHQPPFSAKRAEEARAALAALVAADADDEAGVAARYHLARLHQDYLEPADPAGALRLHEELHADHPASAYGQHAFIKALLLRFAAASPADRRGVLDAAEPAGAALASPELRRSWHLVMSVAHLQLDRRSPEALRHALAADALPGGHSVVVADNLLRVAELARELGRDALAADYYARFAASRPRDARAAYARARVAELSPAAAHAVPASDAP